MLIKKFIFAVFTAAIAGSAHAFVYSNLTAPSDPSLIGISGTGILTVGGSAIGPANTNANIDFFPNTAIAGGVSGIVNNPYTFTYDVHNDLPVAQIGATLLGTIAGRGTISFNEKVFQLVGGNVTGPALVDYSFAFNSSTSDARLTRASDNFTFTDNTGLFRAATGAPSPQTDYRVIKTLTLSVGSVDYNHATDYATVSLVEQNHQPVPEPATMAALGLGTLGMIKRRKKQS